MNSRLSAKRAILLLGAPGVGKSTQTKLITSQSLGIMSISTGSLVRELDTKVIDGLPLNDLEKEAAKDLPLMREGKNMSAKAVYALLMAHLSPGGAGHEEYTRSHTILLDGVIREHDHIEAFNTALQKFNSQVDVPPILLDRVINLTAPEKELLLRHTIRVHEASLSSISSRPDDSDEKYQERLAAYIAATQSIIDYYKSNSSYHFIEVDGIGSVAQTAVLLLNTIKANNPQPQEVYSLPKPVKSRPDELNEVDYCAFFNKTKHAEYDFLSNFHEQPVETALGIFTCSEGWYQYLKFSYLNDAHLLKKFQDATGQVAYDLSRELKDKINPDWDRLQAMRLVQRDKYKNPELKQKLLDTDSKYLVENSPNGHDNFWADNGDGTGQNMLGQLLMELRAELGGTGVVPRPAMLDLFYAHKCDHCTNCAHFTNKGVILNFCDSHMTHELKLGKFSKQIHLSDIPTGAGRFLYFKTNDIPELVEEGARLIAERIQAAGLENPYFVTPEASTIGIALSLQTKYKIPGVVICKSKKPNDFDTYHVDYSAITSKEVKRLYLDKAQAKEMEGKDIVIFDNVCTTGETLRAVYHLLMQAGVHTDKIREAIVLFTEGEDVTSLKISHNYALPLHRFCHLPLFPADLSVDQSRYRLYSAATFPTTHGILTTAVFHDKASTDKEALAHYSPTTFDKGYDDITVRVHDACYTSEVIGSVKCDCKQQLDYALDYINEKQSGILIYLNQEGRGIGLGNKIAAYHLQQTQGLNTVEANRALGLPDDIRHYEAVRDILKTLGVKSIRLLTNNPRKVACLTELGIQVNGTIPCITEPTSKEMRAYMQTKAKQMGHMISDDVFATPSSSSNMTTPGIRQFARPNVRVEDVLAASSGNLKTFGY